ncbi:MAG: shikimate kinase [Propionibacteriaceae bacterium]|jgi:shikimate kinase|nr:shikimate kinase [Propionibacteriaceae bacterium]
MSYVIVGLPASGKSTVGARLAHRLGQTHLDTDALVERRAGKIIREIFADDGEAAFRELEEAAVREALSTEGAVVSLGGGAVVTPGVRQMVASHTVVWLDVSVRTLTRRAGMNQLRPLLLGDARRQLEILAEARRPLYAEVATWRIDSDRMTPSQVVDAIMAAGAGENVDADSGKPRSLSPRPAAPAPTGGAGAGEGGTISRVEESA